VDGAYPVQYFCELLGYQYILQQGERDLSEAVAVVPSPCQPEGSPLSSKPSDFCRSCFVLQRYFSAAVSELVT
jgi:hypothetical protein